LRQTALDVSAKEEQLGTVQAPVAVPLADSGKVAITPENTPDVTRVSDAAT
jgi:hypothetical protein